MRWTHVLIAAAIIATLATPVASAHEGVAWLVECVRTVGNDPWPCRI